jgi:hypothetical protein
MRTLLWDLGLGLVGPRRCSRRGKIGVVYELEQREVTTRNAGARKGSRITAALRTYVHSYIAIHGVVEGERSIKVQTSKEGDPSPEKGP